MSTMSYMYGMRDMKAPCQDCKAREVGCHGSCESYKAFKEERAEQKKKVVEYKKKHIEAAKLRGGYINDSTARRRSEHSYLNTLNANKRATGKGV